MAPVVLSSLNRSLEQGGSVDFAKIAAEVESGHFSHSAGLQPACVCRDAYQVCGLNSSSCGVQRNQHSCSDDRMLGARGSGMDLAC
jgi:hypothetical protein